MSRALFACGVLLALALPRLPTEELRTGSGQAGGGCGRVATEQWFGRTGAKLTGHVWSFAELFETVMPAKVAA